MKLEVAQARKEKRELQYENTQLKIQLKARKAPKHIKVGGEFVTENQNKSIPGDCDTSDWFYITVYELSGAYFARLGWHSQIQFRVTTLA